MALTTVVTDRFFERLLKVLRQLDEDGKVGPLTLAMLVPSTVDDDFRSLVLSSPHLDSIRLSEATSMILEKLRRELGKDAAKIDTVSILRTYNSAVRFLGETYDIPQLGSAYRATGLPMLALGLNDPILFISKQVVAVAA